MSSAAPQTTRTSKPSADGSHGSRLSPMSTVLWALYVGMSWTWCIGMFLPIILLRDYGLWSFAFFAIPNVLGAAAMAWIYSPQTSAAFVQRHRAACSIFSIVTAAFNLFFLMHLANRCASDDIRSTAMLVGAFVAVACVVLLPRRATIVAALVFIISLVAIGWSLTNGDARSPLDAAFTSTAWRPDLLAIAPVLALGFLTCPWFDVTFQHAVVHAGARRKPVFALGFGIFFLAMIVFTPFYAAQFIDPASLSPGATKAFVALASLPIAIHLMAQLTFTIAVHVQHVATPTQATSLAAPAPADAIAQTSHIREWIWALIGALALGGLVFAFNAPPLARLTPFETVYMTFMAFYGLVIPAYALNCAIPTADRTAGPTRAKLIITTLGILGASPFFVQGFLLGMPNALVLGVGVLFLSRAVTMLLHRRAAA
ncbi:MAG: hypothetical protein K2X32_14470 [Phycisphaerales bacterium]|nr:hypothetical protein [Phycisphaerales bacterium]